MIVRRLALLYLGIALYGLSSAVMVRAGMGLDAWNVLHQGIARHVALSFGTIIIAVGAVLMLLWIPLRQKPGLGTLSNVVLVGLFADAALRIIHAPQSLAGRLTMMAIAIALNGVATGMYIGAGMGAGPRDGLMTGLARRRGWSIRASRTVVEISVLCLGWLLGGRVGLGTLLYAVAIGSIVQVTLPAFQAVAHAPSCSDPRGRSLAGSTTDGPVLADHR